MGRERKLIEALVQARTQFAGVGTRKAKLVLNRLAKTDVYARALRIALESEDNNLTAKRYFGGDIGGQSYAQINYLKKCGNIEALIVMAKAEGWPYGVHTSDAGPMTHVIYFDIPGVRQVSWHYSPVEHLPVYSGAWDGQVGSTLPKLEVAISALLRLAEAPSKGRTP